MAKHKVVHFEIPVTDFGKAKDFYGKVFDWKTEMWENNYLMATTTDTDANHMTSEYGGINGGMYIKTKAVDQPSIVIETDSIEATLKDVVKAGGTVSREKSPVGTMGFMAAFTDPDGNTISLFEYAKKN